MQRAFLWYAQAHTRMQRSHHTFQQFTMPVLLQGSLWHMRNAVPTAALTVNNEVETCVLHQWARQLCSKCNLPLPRVLLPQGKAEVPIPSCFDVNPLVVNRRLLKRGWKRWIRLACSAWGIEKQDWGGRGLTQQAPPRESQSSIKHTRKLGLRGQANEQKR